MNDSGSLSARMEAFRSRSVAYQNLGYDRFGAARLVAEMAGPLRGPALDVGTGKAVMASTLAALRGIDVVTIDIDDSERELAELIAYEAGVRDRIQFVHADAKRFPFSDGHFGCAVMLDVLHHLAESSGVLGEMARVVSVGGAVVVADFTAAGFEIVEQVLRADGREHDPGEITVDEIVDAAPGLGLKLVLRAEGFVHDVAVFRKGDYTTESHP